MPACTLNMHFQPTLVFDPWNAHNLNGTSFRETITWCMMVFWRRSPLLNLPPCRPSVWVIARFLLENAVMPKSPNLLLDKTPSWAGQQNLLNYAAKDISGHFQTIDLKRVDVQSPKQKVTFRNEFLRVSPEVQVPCKKNKKQVNYLVVS